MFGCLNALVDEVWEFDVDAAPNGEADGCCC